MKNAVSYIVFVASLLFVSAPVFADGFRESTWSFAVNYKNASIGTVKQSLVLTGKVRLSNQGYCQLIIGNLKQSCSVEVYTVKEGFRADESTHQEIYVPLSREVFLNLVQTYANHGQYADRTIELLKRLKFDADKNGNQKFLLFVSLAGGMFDGYIWSEQTYLIPGINDEMLGFDMSATRGSEF